jgi:hypothetical protein
MIVRCGNVSSVADVRPSVADSFRDESAKPIDLQPVSHGRPIDGLDGRSAHDGIAALHPIICWVWIGLNQDKVQPHSGGACDSAAAGDPNSQFAVQGAFIAMIY